MNDQKAFQDYYPDSYSHCYGCGRLNPHGLRIKSYWEGDETVCRFDPKPYHTAVPGFVYGGLIASLVDCHGTGSAAAALYRSQNRPMDSEPPIRCVTAALKVDYLNPTPIDATLELRGTIVEVGRRKAKIAMTVSARGVVCAKGEMLAVQMPDSFSAK